MRMTRSWDILRTYSKVGCPGGDNFSAGAVFHAWTHGGNLTITTISFIRNQCQLIVKRREDTMNNMDFNEGGVLMHILWATSIIRLENEVKAGRQKLAADFDTRIAADPDNKELIAKKEKCLAHFDKANEDTMSKVEQAHRIFAENPEFAGLLL